MTYAAVITHVQAEATPRLACARALAQRFGARLIGLGVEMIPPQAFDSGFYVIDGDWTLTMRQSVDAQLTAAHEVFKRETAAMPSADTAWLRGIDSPTPALAAASRAADLIVIGGGPRRATSPYRDVAPAELAIQAGRPVLLIPADAHPLEARKVVLAWKDTREARRALSDALAFLEIAEDVLVLEVCGSAEDEDAAIRTKDVAGALARRGITAEPRVVAHGHRSAADTILDEAKGFGADLIVLGCYGHSRLGEWVFGGVTCDLLAQDEAYLLLSH
jgi:nucleotide-binding universal stress UspA family protein